MQAVIFMTVTGLLGTPWLATGWLSVALPVLGAIVAAAGISIGIAGFVHSDGLLQMIGGGGPSLLALLGGAFFPLDVAPAGVQRLAVINPVYWAMEALTGGYVYQGFVESSDPVGRAPLDRRPGMVIGVQGSGDMSGRRPEEPTHLGVSRGPEVTGASWHKVSRHRKTRGPGDFGWYGLSISSDTGSS